MTAEPGPGAGTCRSTQRSARPGPRELCVHVHSHTHALAAFPPLGPYFEFPSPGNTRWGGGQVPGSRVAPPTSVRTGGSSEPRPSPAPGGVPRARSKPPVGAPRPGVPPSPRFSGPDAGLAPVPGPAPHAGAWTERRPRAAQAGQAQDGGTGAGRAAGHRAHSPRVEVGGGGQVERGAQQQRHEQVHAGGAARRRLCARGRTRCAALARSAPGAAGAGPRGHGQAERGASGAGLRRGARSPSGPSRRGEALQGELRRRGEGRGGEERGAEQGAWARRPPGPGAGRGAGPWAGAPREDGQAGRAPGPEESGEAARRGAAGRWGEGETQERGPGRGARSAGSAPTGGARPDRWCPARARLSRGAQEPRSVSMRETTARLGQRSGGEPRGFFSRRVGRGRCFAL